MTAVPKGQRAARVDDPVDAELRAPHPALLVSWALAFLSFVAVIAATDFRLLAGPPAVVTTVLLAVVAGAGAIALLAVPRTRTLPAALAGIVLLDVAAPLLQAMSASPSDARARAALLILPTMIAAATLGRFVYLAQLIGAVGLAAVMLAFTSDDRGMTSHLIEIGVAAGVLVASSVMVRNVSQATTGHIADLRRLALTDRLTGALNRRGLADGFTALRADVKRGTRIGVLSMDIDHFKWFNDTYGHAAGDDVLRTVCRVLTEVAGPHGLAARTGGEELVALVRGPAEPVAEEFRARLARQGQPRVTVSIGVVDVEATPDDGPDTLWQTLDAADKAMYRAKTTGRDKICRGHVDQRTKVRPPLAPAPQHAAVASQDEDSEASTSPFPGWVLAIFGLLGMMAGLLNPLMARAPGLISELYLTSMATCLLAGILVIAMGPLVDRFRWVTGIIGTDLVILLSSAALDDGPGRVVALSPLLLTGLMTALQFGRRALALHHAVCVAICMTAPAYPFTPTAVVPALLTALIVIGATELIYFLQQRNRAAAIDLHRWSVTDPLTGLANRHGLELGFENLSRAQQLTVLALDVDDFKAINDTYGHAAGDDALVRLSQTLRAVTSADTVVCRSGGDEFVVLAPDMRPSSLTSKVKRAAALLPLPLSVSIGSAVAAPRRLRSLWQLVDAADAALMRAKRSRRQQRSRTQPGSVDDEPAPVTEQQFDGPDAAARAELDRREFGAYSEELASIDSEDGSSAATSTRTVSPSVSSPAKSRRAS